MCDWWSLSSRSKAHCELPFFGLGYLKNQDNDRSASPLTWGAPPPRCIDAVVWGCFPIFVGGRLQIQVKTMSKTHVSKAQQARMNNESDVEKLATRLRRGTKAAVKDLQAILVNASGLGIMHQTLTRIQGAFITGDAKNMADAIEATYTGKPDKQGRIGESSNLAWLMHIIHGKENPWTPGERKTKRKLTAEDKAWLRANCGNDWFGADGVTDPVRKAESIAALDAFKAGAPAPEPMAEATAPEVTPIHMTQSQIADFKAFLEAQKNA